jgi:hypothetical protein
LPKEIPPSNFPCNLLDMIIVRETITCCLVQAKESGIKDGVGMTEDDEKLLAEDDDELDLDDEELDELEASVSKTSLHDT